MTPQDRLAILHPELFLEVQAFTKRYAASIIEFSRLAFYCVDRGVPHHEIVPLFSTVGFQAGARYDEVIMQMADDWRKPPLIERILKQ